MLRVVLAAALAVALLGVALPVLEDASAERSATIVEGELDAVATAAGDLLAREEVAPRGAASRRVLSVSVPGRGLAEAPVAYVALGGVPDCRAPRDAERGDVLAYRLAGGDPRVRSLPVDLRTVAPDGTLREDEPLVLRGDSRVALSLVDGGDEPVVLVERVP